MKWKEFKKKLKDAGITDDMEIWYIDMSFDSDLEITLPYPPKKDEDVLGFSVWN